MAQGLPRSRARELGLQKSVFMNATGLPDPKHKTTARELAQMARYLIEVFPKEYSIYSRPDFTWNNIRQGNRRVAIRHYLMLRRIGAPVAAPTQRQCRDLLARTPIEVVAQIAVSVDAWFDMLATP